MSTKLLSMRRAARVCRCRDEYVRNLVSTGKITGFRKGKRTILVDPTDVAAEIRKHRVNPTAVAPEASAHADRVLADRGEK
jgi:hypothetical protein